VYGGSAWTKKVVSERRARLKPRDEDARDARQDHPKHLRQDGCAKYADGARALGCPFSNGFGAIVVAHLLSVFFCRKPRSPHRHQIALRPRFVRVPHRPRHPRNFIRSWRRMDEACLALTLLATWFAFDGLRSLLDFSGDAFGLYRARPLPFFGLNPLGGNHHALAELMVLVAPLAWALSERASETSVRHLYRLAAGVFWGVALLTFARAAWLIVIMQLVVLSVTIWREHIRTHWKTLARIGLVLSPLALYMIWFSLLPAAYDSLSARAILLDVSWSLFRDHPLVGVGAGTFPERLSRILAFTVEFGTSQDAHGMWQKVAAETGFFGLTALTVTLAWIARLVRMEWRRLKHPSSESRWFMCLAASVLGTLSYQLFSTSLWSPRVWISVGLLLAGMRLLRTNAVRRDPDFLQG
jgi:Lipid A core - O-antigen ligase and related enzymes